MAAALLMVVLLISAMPAAIAESFSAVVKSKSMAVYSNASLSKRLGTLGQFSVVKVNSYSGGVAKISYMGKTCYAKISAMERVDTIATPAVVKTNTKVFAEPKTNSASIPLAKGTKVNLIVANGAWALIEKDGVGGFTNLGHLTQAAAPKAAAAKAAPKATAKPVAKTAAKAKTAATTKAVVNANTKVYQKASTSSASINVPKGTKVDVLAVNGGWSYVRSAAGVNAFIPSKYLSAAAAATPKPAATAKPAAAIKANTKAAINANTKVYQKASTSSASINVPKGTQVLVLAVNNGWAYVRSTAGVNAFIPTKYLSAAAAATPTPQPAAAIKANSNAVINANTKVYQKASASSASINVPKGTKVYVLAINSGWAYVRSAAGINAFIPTKYLTAEAAAPKPAATKAIINADTRVYKSASTSSASIKVPKGTKVDVLSANGGWSYIRSSAGVNAYIPSKYLSPVPDNNGEQKLGSAVAAVVTANEVKVYSHLNNGTLSGTLKKGTKVKIIATNKDKSWAKIEVNGKQFWCKADALGPDQQEAADPLKGYTKETFGATVITTNAKYYDVAGEGDGVSIPFGTNVTVGAFNDQWAFVTVNDRYGFVAVSALSRTKYSPLAKGTSGSAVAALEKALLNGGYFDGQPDNNFDSATETAVKRFQSACNLSASGEASETLQRMLLSGNGPVSSMLSNALSKGAKGDSVTRLQTRLYALGYLSKSGSIDGDYGNTTASAISLFQNCNELSTSGKADSSTLRKLYSSSAATLPSGKLPADQGGSIVQPQSGNQKNNSTTISSTLASKTSRYSDSMSAAEKIEYIIYLGQNQLGKPYVYGANGTSSYDCTGFTCYCFRQIGITLPRTAVSQGYNSAYSRIKNISDLKRGDVVFFNTVSDGDVSDHAGIYLGAGWFVHASSGQGKVVISTLASGYYNRVFSWGHRVLK